MSPLKIIIFDCDGVLFDSKEANRFYYNHLLEKFGHPPMTPEELEYVHMHHAMDSTRHIFRDYPESLAAAEKYRESLNYMRFLKYMIMEPDLIDFLTQIRKKYKTAISTNRTTTMSSVMAMNGLTPYFDMVVTALDVKNPKPHPEALIAILGKFNLTVDEAIYVGDSMVDRDHAASIGMRLIAFKNADLPAAFHVKSFMEINDLPIF
ncbi:MAG: HAD family hydrolase [Proteobacteria bacterium]|nr:HAD family hydrolase [Pseudomonadota bacterium]MBU1709388.1 HAD family hydrolase [Pseudomonadota bacterium]